MFPAVAFLILIAAPAAAPQYPAFLTGRWFGQGEPNDKSEMWLGSAFPNGDFEVQFRACRKGKPYDLFQKGKWWFQDGTEFVQITLSNGQVVFNETPYRILFHDGNHQTYSMPSGFVFRSNRVDADYHMPDCDLVS
ncbi:MAG TPA: hypothetical protein VNX61_12665 [Rhizomicrobium sp.]|jgi:hypothetical protein|nr:hypothetical protein [Rhizomicrobium sp.]